MVRFRASMVPLASPDTQSLAILLCDDADRSIVSVRLEIRWFIGDEVAAADQLVQPIKGTGQGADIPGKHGLTSAALCECLQDLVGIRFVANGVPCAETVDCHARGFHYL